MANYISVWHDKYRKKIVAWESLGSPRRRVRREIDPEYFFYIPNRLGDFTSLTGEKLKKVTCHNQDEFDQAVQANRLKFESDFDPLERAFQNHYAGKEAPELVTGFVDIEVDYDPAIGFAGPKNPYAIINAITMIKSTGEIFTFAVPPLSLSQEFESRQECCDQLMLVCKEIPGLEHVELFPTENKLLERFLFVLQDCDVVSGWNSEFFDIPYIAKRVELILGDTALQLLSFEGGPKLRWTEKPRFKHSLEKDPVVDLITRAHLDYMALFQKFNLTRRQSYSLNAVCLTELNEEKLEYDGTLAELYTKDFLKFIEYNIHDTRLLIKLEAKFKYIELANQMVHEATVNFKDIFGSVHIIDSAITNYAHLQLNIKVNDRVSRPDGDPVEGAIVMTPVPGFYEWIGAVDINSLYPNTIRSLNLSPEKIIGQLQNHEADWRLFSAGMAGDEAALGTAVQALLDGEPEPVEIEIRDLIELCLSSKFAISGYGTILDQNAIGLLPSILGYWFNGRKDMQAEKKKYATLAESLLKAGKPKDDPEYLEAKRLEGLFDLRQGVRKVQLNSLYGALLNAYMRFGDPRLGASTTFSGRQITSHMVNTATGFLGSNKKISKTVNHITKKKRSGAVETKIENEYIVPLTKGEPGVIYGDTDSAYFTMQGLVTTDEEAIALANAAADAINESFPGFMKAAFNCQPGFETLIKANRELVCRTGILQAKKKYMMAVIDKEGKPIQAGSDDELKTMGSDIKLSSTPEAIRVMLKDVVMGILNKVPKAEIDEIIMTFRRGMKADSDLNLDPLDLATVNSVNSLEKYQLLWQRTRETGIKATIPANAQSAINYNAAIERLGVNERPIVSGDKIKILWLRPNSDGIKNIAFPSDNEKLPDWFTAVYEVDTAAMEQKLVDQKLQNIFDALEWEVPTLQTQLTATLLDFD